MSRFQDGAYVGHEEETTRAALRSEEGYCYYGTQHIPDYLPAGLYSARPHRVGKFSLFKDLPQSASLPGTDIPLRDGVIKTEIEFTMTASQLKEKFSYDLGPEYAKHDAVKMVAVVANEQKVIKFEPCGYLHGQYSYDVIEYSPDHNNFVNPGISDTVHNLQEIMTWFLNSHIQNVRKSIKNRFIGDPSKIHVEDLTNGNEFVRTKDMMGKTIKDVVYSMETNDVTRGHVADIQVLNSLIQVVTGINENALGQYATGRRSATEARSVTSAAGARLKMHGMIAWVMGIEPLGQKLIANTNQLRSREFYEMIIGEDIEKYPYEKTIVAPPHLIAGGFNFMPYEGTLPNDKERHAGHFVELFKSVMSNPQAMVALTKLDLNKVLNHIFSLYGVKNFSDFILAPEQLNQDLQTSVLPDLAVEELKNQGQLQRVSMPNEVME
ncbi:MAG: hypothetical protein HC840_01165 [Leptolyngbyaceae cyanobacterium RM2_2_4]|nr:hypothetical protein [Leptolyngbyaceae cyanobacterium RM2_2_4]